MCELKKKIYFQNKLKTELSQNYESIKNNFY